MIETLAIFIVPAFASFVSEFLIRRREIQHGQSKLNFDGSGFWIGLITFWSINMLLYEYVIQIPPIVSFTAFLLIPFTFFILGYCVATFYYVKRKSSQNHNLCEQSDSCKNPGTTG
ncbi:hypothetical protein EU528_02270 [Candidatus Thorarchaeota archaeon]|nr:MAG: hypothetical protein EU528_02270 [Candidatus Thorarchaeota archaeon]